MRFEEKLDSISYEWPSFNRDPLDFWQLTARSEELGIETAKSTAIQGGCLRITDGAPRITYNPELPALYRALVIGHELGHFLLGHISDGGGAEFSPLSHCRGGDELEATIFAHLCLLPTPLIETLHEGTPQALHSRYRHLWSDEDEVFAWQICEDRLKIFEEYLFQMNHGALCRGEIPDARPDRADNRFTGCAEHPTKTLRSEKRAGFRQPAGFPFLPQ